MSHSISICPHNDLLNLAHYQLEVINSKVKDGNRDSLSLDCMACLTSLAFAVEGLLNFIGHLEIDDWKEFQPYEDKIKQVCGEIAFSYDRNKEPFKTLWEVKDFRDSLAHVKPIEGVTDVSTKEDIFQALSCDWEKLLNPKFVNHAFEQVKLFKQNLFDLTKLDIGDTITSAINIDHD